MNEIYSQLFFVNLGTHSRRLNLYTGVRNALDTPLGSTSTNCIFLAVFFDEQSFLEGALRSELTITSFAERFKTAAIIGKIIFNSTLGQSFKNCKSVSNCFT